MSFDLPPVHLHHIFDPAFFEIFPIPESRIDRGISFLTLESSERSDIHMIVVVVREKDDIDLWEILEANPYVSIASWSYPLPRTGTLTPDRIGEDIDPVSLYEVRGMPNIGKTDALYHSFSWFDLSDRSFFPLCFFAVEEPVDETSFFAIGALDTV